MSNLTQITDKLFALSVPINSEKFHFVNSDTKYICFFGSETDNIKLNVSTLDKYEILGTVDLESISFDCHPYCESDPINIRKYKLYPQGATNFNKESFRSLLKSKGIEPTSESKVLILERI